MSGFVAGSDVLVTCASSLTPRRDALTDKLERKGRPGLDKNQQAPKGVGTKGYHYKLKLS